MADQERSGDGLQLHSEIRSYTIQANEPMRVSVVVPLYNKAPYVIRCLRSVSAQTYRDFETIVIDDGSTDGSDRIVDTFSEPRLRAFRQANGGPGAARNRGVREARGEYVAFLDADDEWLPEYLASSVRALDEAPNAATVSSSYFEEPKRRRGTAHRNKKNTRYRLNALALPE